MFDDSQSIEQILNFYLALRSSFLLSNNFSADCLEVELWFQCFWTFGLTTHTVGQILQNVKIDVASFLLSFIGDAMVGGQVTLGISRQ